MGWLIAVILAILLFRTRRRLKYLMKESASQSDTETIRPSRSAMSHRHIYDLIVLRLELGRLRGAGEFDPDRYEDVTQRLDTTLSMHIEYLWAVPQSPMWRKAREAGWALLIRHHALLQGPPPWQRETASEGVPTTPVAAVAVTPVTLPADVKAALAQPVDIPPIPSEPVSPRTPAPPAPVDAPSARGHELGAVQASHTTPPAPAEDTASYALEPAGPGTLERALHAVSGWPALLVPFLAQNIGWFIGGFWFVAGSIFLVSYTTGFAKALTIFGVLFAYTMLVFWTGYQLRRRRPALAMSSRVLMTIGVLLVPLNIAAAVRLMLTGMPSPVLVALGILAAALGGGGLYVATAVVSGIVDRTLQGRHAQVVMALAAMQLAVPVLALAPYWPVMAGLHSVLLGILVYGFVLFTRDWLHSIFMEQRKIAYYAAGTLVYAALVSFVHVTWGYRQPLALPHGYYGPFLMVLCGVLFYVDAELKQWVTRDTYLSRLSFGIYGLSVLALLCTAAAPGARILTLLLAMGLYGIVIWQYATLPPLYLLLGCSGWLYHTVILHHLPYHGYFLASLPGFAALFAGCRWALRLCSDTLALMGYRVLVPALLGLAAWSVLHAEPGVIAMGTALVMMGLTFAGWPYLPAPLFGDGRVDKDDTLRHRDISDEERNSQWLYIGMLAAVVAVAYAPLWTGLTWATQSACGLLLLAQLWTVLGLRWRWRVHGAGAVRAEVLLNGVVLHLGLFLLLTLAITIPDVTAYRVLPLLLVLAGSVMLQLSWKLSVQWLFYGVILLWGAAGVITKMTYVPEPSPGATMMALGVIVWGLLWWVERAPAEVAALRREQADLRHQYEPPLMLLWFWPVSSRPYQDIIRAPLQQAMVLLGVVGLTELGMRLLAGDLSWTWVVSAALGVLLALLVTGRWRLGGLLPLALTLGFGAWLTAAFKLGVTTSTGLSLAGAVYALLAWQTSIMLLAHSATRRLARLLRLHGNPAQLEHVTHWTTFIVIMLCLLIPLGQYGLFRPSLVFLLGLVTAMVFLWLTGQRYRQWLHSYVLLGSGILGTILCYAWVFYAHVAPFSAPRALLSDPGLGLTFVLASFVLWAIAWTITRRRNRIGVPVDMAHSLYRKPLQAAAACLALMAVAQQLALVLPGVSGAVYTGGFLAIGVLGLAGISLLLTNHALGKPLLSLAGMCCVVLAVLWGQGIQAHGSPVCTVWFGNSLCVDQWLTLAILALGVACLGQSISRDARSKRLYTQPLHTVAALTYGWALLGAGALFASPPVQAHATLPWLFLALTVALVPVAQPLRMAPAVRGLGMALLLTAGVVSVLALGGWSAFDRGLFVMWAYVVWVLGNMALPRYNARWSRWTIASEPWPWLGLVLMGIAFGLWGLQGHMKPGFDASRLGWYLSGAALYLVLMLRNSAWPGFPWLAVLTLMGAGVVFNMVWLLPVADETTLLRFAIVTVGWANLLLLGISMWRRYGAELSSRLRWPAHDLVTPLLFWPSVWVHLWVALLALVEAGVILLQIPVTEVGPWKLCTVLTGGVLTLSCLHILWLWRNTWHSHLCMAALLCTLLAAWLGTAARLFHLPLFFALWSVILLALDVVGTHRQWRAPLLAHMHQALSQWLVWSPLAAVVLWVLLPQPLGERLLTLGVVGGVMACLGWRRQHPGWFFAAMAVLVVQLHAWWLFHVPPGQIVRLMPWVALQLAGLTWCALWLRHRVQHAIEADNPARQGETRLSALEQALSWLLRPLAVLALLAWIQHALVVCSYRIATRPLPWLTGDGEVLVAVAALLLLMALGIRQVWQTQRARWVYGVMGLGAALGLHIRMVWIGLAPVQVWDTVVLIGAAYALFVLQRLTLSRPIFHVVMVLPLLAVGTVPLQLASPHASGTLLTVGMLYLLARRTTGHDLPLYLGLVAVNAGIYLWVPGWADNYHMVQVYTIPAAVSVLGLLHLHGHDVKPSVLHSVRLATISVLYASATLDVFLRAEFAIFIAVLVLSLAGVIIGIALRTRAFLYAGVTFLIVNVVGQLLLLFPEQRLGKAIVLLLLGTVITGGMIWFNAQREAILQRLRLFRADVETWA